MHVHELLHSYKLTYISILSFLWWLTPISSLDLFVKTINCNFLIHFYVWNTNILYMRLKLRVSTTFHQLSNICINWTAVFLTIMTDNGLLSILTGVNLQQTRYSKYGSKSCCGGLYCSCLCMVILAIAHCLVCIILHQVGLKLQRHFLISCCLRRWPKD